MGTAIRQNKNIDIFLTNLENQVKGINDFVRFLLVKDSLLFLKKLFGWSAIFFTVIYIALAFLKFGHNVVIPYIVIPFIISFYIWFSISWVIDHKSYLKKSIPKEWMFFPFCSFIVLVFDWILNTNYFSLIDGFIKKEFSCLNYINLPYGDYSVSWAVFYIVASASFIFIWYIFVWVFSIPIFLIAFLVVLLPIYFAKFIDKISPKTPLVGIVIIVWIICFLYT